MFTTVEQKAATASGLFFLSVQKQIMFFPGKKKNVLTIFCPRRENEINLVSQKIPRKWKILNICIYFSLRLCSGSQQPLMINLGITK